MASTRTDRIDLATIRTDVFDRRSMSADVAAEPFTLDALVQATKSIRERIQAILVSAPDCTFDVPTHSTSGEPEWSAGQVVSHICEARVRFDSYGAIRKLAGIAELPPSESWLQYIGGPKMLDRDQSIAAIDLLDSEFAALVADLPANVDLDTRIELAPFGILGIKGVLMQSLLHEDLHADQIEDLDR